MKMKLLDLQTGKYLELGNDWLYGGNAIHISNPKSVGYYCFTQKPHTNPIINQIAEKVGAVIYGGRYVLLETKNITQGIAYPKSKGVTYQRNIGVGDIHSCAGSYTTKHIDFNEIDNYNHSRLRFSTNEQEQNIVEAILEAKYEPFVFINSTRNGIMPYLTFESKGGTAIASVFGQSAIMEYLGNIFEEFAKKEQVLENKFDELQSKTII